MDVAAAGRVAAKNGSWLFPSSGPNCSFAVLLHIPALACKAMGELFCCTSSSVDTDELRL